MFTKGFLLRKEMAAQGRKRKRFFVSAARFRSRFPLGPLLSHGPSFAMIGPGLVCLKIICIVFSP